MKKVTISTSNKSYNVFIGNNILRTVLNNFIFPKYNSLFIVVDDNVWKNYKTFLSEVFGSEAKYKFYIQKSGESRKSFESIQGITESLLKNNFGRDTLLIANGGGVTGDLAGFAASVFMRGIKLVHIPTTLLAAVDSSIGGKTGINFKGYKNIIGAFHQPELVIIDTKFLSTLPAGEINSGTGELVKYAFLTDKDYYDFLNNNFNKIYKLDEKVINKLIYKSVLFKGSVVSQDEQESSLRKILNLGHTFAHAYESVLNYSIKHGEAVCAGIISALYLSYKKEILSERKLNQYLQLPLKMILTDNLIIKNVNKAVKFMYGDKKNREGEIRFVLLNDIGKIITNVKVDKSEIVYAIKMTNRLIEKNILV